MKISFRLLVVVIACFCSNAIAQAQIKTFKYEITAKNLSLETVDSYPQKLLKSERKDSLYRLVISTFSAYDDSIKRKIALADKYDPRRIYPKEIRLFLKPTSLTNYRLREVKQVVDSISRLNNVFTYEIINHLLRYTKGRITYDNDLAMKLDAGTCMTLPVEEILEKGRGTCSEYTNLFLALARKSGIPSRMIVGYIYMPDNNFQGAHAWAECYVPNYGWLAVDPQNAFIWYPPQAIKLFYGRDFIDCRISTLPDMYPVNVKIME